MTTQTEREEMRAEIQEALKSTHPLMLFRQACEGGDKAAAEEILDVARDRLSGRERFSMSRSLNAYFPETPEEWKARQAEQGAEARSAVGESLAARLTQRREQAQKITARYKPYAGEHVPRREGVEYAEPDPGGFNTPLDRGTSEQRGFNRIRGLYNTDPEGETP